MKGPSACTVSCLLTRACGGCLPLQLRDEVNKYRVGAPARVGLVAPNDVVVPAGNTGLDPSQTSFFQARSLSFPGALNSPVCTTCTTGLCEAPLV